MPPVTLKIQRIFLTFTLVFIHGSALGLTAQSDPVTAPWRSDSLQLAAAGGLRDIDLYLYQLENNSASQLKARRKYLQQTVPLERYIEDFADRGFEAVIRDTVSLLTLFDHDNSILSIDGQREFLPDVYEVATRRKSHELRLMADIFKTGLMNNLQQYASKMEAYERLLVKARKAGYTALEAYILTAMWHSSYFSEWYARSFDYLDRLDGALERTDDKYPFKGLQYIWPGIAYYHFGDYDRGYYYLHKGLQYRDSSHLLLGGNYLRAWNYLASYHKRKGDRDSSAYYNRLILSSPEGRLSYPMHVDIALANLGFIEIDKGNTQDGAKMLLTVLEHTNAQGADREFIAGVHVALGEYYLSRNDLVTAKTHIDKGYEMIAVPPQAPEINRLKGLNILESKYHARLGNHRQAARHLDSAFVLANLYRELRGRHIISLSEQHLQQARLEISEQQVQRQRNVILFTVIVILLTLAAFWITWWLYRRKQAAYRVLAAQASRWAHGGENSPVPKLGDQAGTGRRELLTPEEQTIMARIEKELSDNHAYDQEGLTAEMLAGRLGIHRNMLSKVINASTGGNFNHYINGLRIKEAVRIISQTKGRKVYIDDLGGRVGFANHSSFYRAFKQFTGLSPTEFRKNIERQSENTIF